MCSILLFIPISIHSYLIRIGNTDGALAINLSQPSPGTSQVTAATRNVGFITDTLHALFSFLISRQQNSITQRWILDPDPSMSNVGVRPESIIIEPSKGSYLGPQVSNSLTVVWTGSRAGGGDGGAFDGSHSVAAARLQEVHVWSDEYINAIQLVYNIQGQTFSTGCVGTRPWGVGTQKTFLLLPGEFIAKVEGRAGWYIDQLRFTTNTGKRHQMAAF